MLRRLVPILAALVLLGCLDPARAAAFLPDGFEDVLVANVVEPTAFAFTPDGRMLITSKYGALTVYTGGTQTTALDLSDTMCTEIERGLLGVAVDPSFSLNHYI